MRVGSEKVLHECLLLLQKLPTRKDLLGQELPRIHLHISEQGAALGRPPSLQSTSPGTMPLTDNSHSPHAKLRALFAFEKGGKRAALQSRTCPALAIALIDSGRIPAVLEHRGGCLQACLTGRPVKDDGARFRVKRLQIELSVSPNVALCKEALASA